MTYFQTFLLPLAAVLIGAVVAAFIVAYAENES